MNVESLRLTIGGCDCNASCPFCITKVVGMKNKEPKMNWQRFNVACNYAIKSGAKSVIISSLGEPTLYPAQISEMLEKLMPYNFPLLELQTNGYSISNESYNEYLSEWSTKGLTTILISIVNHDSEKNSKTMNLPYYNIEKNIKKLHDFGYSLRLSCVMFKGGIDSIESLESLIEFAKANKVEQLTVRPVTRPYESGNNKNEALDWVEQHELSEKTKKELFEYLESNGSRLLKLPLGGIVYDVKGQNIALIEAVKPANEDEKTHQLSLFPNGKINYNKRYRGAVLL
ncbi:MAG: radical SAM protein [Candidatus Nanoarchaeia archaeon]|jgi:molybdenum cofactor biosynthesis enzyme MoaA